MNLLGRKFKNSRLDVEIFVYEVEGTEWFIRKNIALSLGYKDPSGTVKYINDTYKKKVYIKTILKASNDKEYDLFCYNVSGTYTNGIVKEQLQVSLTNAGYVYLKNKLKDNKDFGLDINDLITK